VKGYHPRDAVTYAHQTTLKGVMEKEDPDNWEFVVAEKLKTLYGKRILAIMPCLMVICRLILQLHPY
jgi:hypothetical protein